MEDVAAFSNKTGGGLAALANAIWSAGELELKRSVMKAMVARPRWYSSDSFSFDPSSGIVDVDDDDVVDGKENDDTGLVGGLDATWSCQDRLREESIFSCCVVVILLLIVVGMLRGVLKALPWNASIDERMAEVAIDNFILV